ncbi:MAG: hypothetical protein ACLSFJ_03485 [Holdemania filiformis]
MNISSKLRVSGFLKSEIRKEGNRSESRCGFCVEWLATEEIDGEADFHSGSRKNFAVLKFRSL